MIRTTGARLILGSLFLLCLCGSVHGKTTELVIWTTDEGAVRRATMGYVANAFMAFHDDISVRIEAIDENDLAAHVSAAAERSELPALINTGSELMLAFGADHLLDETAAAEIIDALGRERFFAGPLGMLEAGGGAAFYAVPFHGWIQGIWYRRDWFEEASLAPPADWASLLEAARRLHDPEGGRYGILIGTGDDAYAAQVFTQIALANGATLIDAAGQIAVSSEAMLEALRFYKDLAQYTPPGPHTPRSRDFFLQSRLAMMAYSTFIMDDLALPSAAADSLTGDNFPELQGGAFDPRLLGRVAMVPTLRRRAPSTYGSISGLGVLRGLDARTRSAALAFLRFVYRPDVYVTWLHAAPGGMLPVLRDIATSEPFLREPTGVFRRFGRERIQDIIAGFEDLRTFSRVGGRFVPLASRAFAAGVVSRMVRRAVTGEMPVEDAARMAEAELRQLQAAP